MKPTKLLLPGVFFFIAVSLFAQIDKDGVVQIVTYWEPGDSHHYSLEIGTKISLLTGKSESLTSYHFLVDVLERTDTGYLIQWTYSDAVPPVGATAFERRVVEIGEGLKVRFFITDLGGFIGLENWEEIAARVKAAVAQVKLEFAGEPGIEDSIATIMKAFQSKEHYELFAMDEIKLYHMLHGYSYWMDEPLVVEGDTANPFGGTPIMATTTIELSEVDKDKSTAYLIYDRSYEQGALAKAVFEALNGHLPAGGLTAEQTKDLPALDMRIKKQFIFHTGSGWLLEAYSERYAETEGEIRTDTIYIEFLE